jgi:phospholipase D1/2
VAQAIRQSGRKPAWGKLALLALTIVVMGAAWRFTPLAEIARPSHIRAFAHAVASTPWAPLAVIAAYTPAAFLMFPRPLITLFAIVALGVQIGGVCVLAGVMLAALATYYVGRLLPDGIVRRVAGSKFERFTGLLRAHGVMAICAANMLPTPPFGVQGIVAGAIRINVVHYAAGTLLSLIPGLVAALIFGHQIILGLEDPAKMSWTLIGSTGVAMVIIAFLGTRWAAREAKKLNC